MNVERCIHDELPLKEGRQNSGLAPADSCFSMDVKASNPADTRQLDASLFASLLYAGCCSSALGRIVEAHTVQGQTSWSCTSS